MVYWIDEWFIGRLVGSVLRERRMKKGVKS